jgi:hypothetical protein
VKVLPAMLRLSLRYASELLAMRVADVRNNCRNDLGSGLLTRRFDSFVADERSSYRAWTDFTCVRSTAP